MKKASNLYYGVAKLGDISCPHNSFERLVYHRWLAMISRCYNMNSPTYKSYGAKEVKVCDKWLIFKNFYDDLEKIKGYDKEKYISHEIELDKDLNGFKKEYSLENCQFVSVKENREYQKKAIKPFKMISQTGEEKIFLSQSKCARETGLVARSIGKCLNGDLKHHHGYEFKYIEEEEWKKINLNQKY